MGQGKTITLSPSTSLSVTISGTSTKAPTHIFLHFWGGSSRTFSIVNSLFTPNFRCIAVDLPGWGSSTGPQDPDAYTITSLATTIEALILKLDVQDFITIGHSMCGKIAQVIAGRGAVNGLRGVVLIAPAPPSPLELPADMKEQQLAAYSIPESADFVTRNVFSSSGLDDKTVDMLVEDMVKGTELAKAAWPAYGMGEDILEEARKINVPVLVIAGDLDKVETVDRLRREVLGNLKGAEMVVVEGKGHLLPIEAAMDVPTLAREFAGSFAVNM